MNNLELAKMIDHTILKANATQSDIEKLCDEAKKYGVATGDTIWQARQNLLQQNLI